MKTIEAETAKLLKKHGFDSPPIDPEAIAEGEGVEVVYAKFSEAADDMLHGYYDFESNRIVVNDSDPVEEKSFTIAHELGHFLLHKEFARGQGYVPRLKNEANFSFSEEQFAKEAEADLFAMHLIVPKALLNKYRNFATRSELSKLFVATVEVLRRADAE